MKIEESLGKILQVDTDMVNVKGKTKEKTGETGAGRAIEAYATVLLLNK
jgi:2C-methyl-D-erythritol 2,4-cyclodiphosphate synthase